MRQGKLGRSRTLVLAVMPVVLLLSRTSNARDRGVDGLPPEIGALYAAGHYRDRGDAEHMEQAVEAASKVNASDRRLSYYRGVALVLKEKDLAAATHRTRPCGKR